MTTRTTTLGGTDWVDGECLTPADQNDTIEGSYGITSMPIKRYAMTQDTTEYSVTSTTWASVGFSKTFTPPAGTSAWLMALKCQMDNKESGGEGKIRVRILNNTSGNSLYLKIIQEGSGGDAYLFSFNSPTYITNNITVLLSNVRTDDVPDENVVPYDLQNLQDGATYTVTIEAKNTSGTVYAKNITFTAYYAVMAAVVTSGWA